MSSPCTDHGIRGTVAFEQKCLTMRLAIFALMLLGYSVLAQENPVANGAQDYTYFKALLAQPYMSNDSGLSVELKDLKDYWTCSVYSGSQARPQVYVTRVSKADAKAFFLHPELKRLATQTQQFGRPMRTSQGDSPKVFVKIDGKGTRISVWLGPDENPLDENFVRWMLRDSLIGKKFVQVPIESQRPDVIPILHYVRRTARLN